MRNTHYLTECNLWDHYLRAVCSWRNFTGRSSRSEYWGYHFFYLLFYIAWVALCREIGGIFTFSLISMYHLLFLFPSFALLFRRLHDTGRSGWHTLPLGMFLLLWVMLQTGFYSPYDSGITVLYLLFVLAAIACLRLFAVAGFSGSDPGYNKYGIIPYRILSAPPEKTMRTVDI